MDEKIKIVLEEAKGQMDKAVIHVESELIKVRASKATPQMLDGIYVDYYGSPTPLAQIANVNTTDAKTIVVQPWEKSMINPIEKAISESNLGLNPQNDGILIRINVPPLTEERRKDLVKKVKNEAEQGKVAVRNIRKDINERLKKLEKEGVAQDEVKTGEGEVQKLTDGFILKIDKHIEAKEKDIMTV